MSEILALGRNLQHPVRGIYNKEYPMLRTFMCALFAVALCVVTVLADEAKGKVKKVEKGVITVTVGDKDQTLGTPRSSASARPRRASRRRKSPSRAACPAFPPART